MDWIVWAAEGPALWDGFFGAAVGAAIGALSSGAVAWLVARFTVQAADRTARSTRAAEAVAGISGQLLRLMDPDVDPNDESQGSPMAGVAVGAVQLSHAVNEGRVLEVLTQWRVEYQDAWSMYRSAREMETDHGQESRHLTSLAMALELGVAPSRLAASLAQLMSMDRRDVEHFCVQVEQATADLDALVSELAERIDTAEARLAERPAWKRFTSRLGLRRAHPRPPGAR